jgi:peptidoglycan/LPS O-acetylase OafA/YrhL
MTRRGRGGSVTRGRCRRGVLAAALVELVAPAVRVAELHLLPGHGEGIGHRFETVADAMAIGCVLACARERLHRHPVYLRFLASPAFLVVPVAIVAGGMMGDHPHVSYVIGLPVANVATALAIDWAVTYPSGAIGRMLNTRPLVFVGVVSYSLYLWQQPFLNRNVHLSWTAFPINLVLATACALASYYLVERPSLALRRRMERARSHGAPASAVVAQPNVAGPLSA